MIKKIYFLFIKTIVLRPYLEYFYNDSLKNRFAKAIAHEIETSFKELQWKLDYVRLNIHAKNSIVKFEFSVYKIFFNIQNFLFLFKHNFSEMKGF